MSGWQGFSGVNRGYLLELYDRFRTDPSSVDPATRAIFEEIIRADENENVYDLVGLMKRFIEHMMRVVDHELISDIHQQLIARISVLRVLSMSMPGNSSSR